MTEQVKVTPLMIAREIFPGKPDEWLDFAIWNRTAFPFNLPHEWRLQLFELRDAIAECPEGRHLCDMCNRVAKVGDWVCEVCDGYFAQVADHQSAGEASEAVSETDGPPKKRLAENAGGSRG